MCSLLLIFCNLVFSHPISFIFFISLKFSNTYVCIFLFPTIHEHAQSLWRCLYVYIFSIDILGIEGAPNNGTAGLLSDLLVNSTYHEEDQFSKTYEPLIYPAQYQHSPCPNSCSITNLHKVSNICGNLIFEEIKNMYVCLSWLNTKLLKCWTQILVWILIYSHKCHFNSMYYFLFQFHTNTATFIIYRLHHQKSSFYRLVNLHLIGLMDRCILNIRTHMLRHIAQTKGHLYGCHTQSIHLW